MILLIESSHCVDHLLPQSGLVYRFCGCDTYVLCLQLYRLVLQLIW